MLLESAHDVTPEMRLVYILISIGLVLLAGLMSGLTLGLMSMDAVDLEVSRCTIRTIFAHPRIMAATLCYRCVTVHTQNYGQAYNKASLQADGVLLQRSATLTC